MADTEASRNARTRAHDTYATKESTGEKTNDNIPTYTPHAIFCGCIHTADKLSLPAAKGRGLKELELELEVSPRD